MIDETTHPTTRTEKQEERPTIGLAITGTSEVWEQQPWQGVEDAAKEHDVNLFVFVGGALEAEYGFAARANVIYELMTPRCVDGFVTAGALGAYSGLETLQNFCERRHPLPVITFEQAIPGFPGVLLDDYQSMRQVVAHLIEVHGCRRIAYAGDPSSAHAGFRARYRAYVEILQAHGLVSDSNLVYSRWEEGVFADEAATVDWYRERVSGLDALTGQEDSDVLSGLRALQSLGVRVPGDVAVASFNDLVESRVTTPPLTTMRPPFYGMGQRAAENLLALLGGEQVPEQETLVGRLMVRQSCGCMDPKVAQVAVGPVERTDEALETALAAREEEILARIAQSMEPLTTGVDPSWPGRWMDAFVAALAAGRIETTNAFISELDETLRQTALAGGDVAAWQGATSVFRRQMLPYLNDEGLARAEGLWQQARVAVTETALRAKARAQLQAAQQAQVLREIGAALITTFDVEELMSVLTEGLPRLGIPSCYLSLYENPQEPAEWSRLVLAYDENGRVELEPGGQRFRSQQLVPEGLRSGERRYSFVVMPLYFRDRQLGFCLFEVGPREGTVYDVLRAQISSALQGALLLREREQAEAALQQAYAEVEQQVQERTAELGREAEERERAQEENLRLQQEVIEAQKRALQELSSPIIPIMKQIIVLPLIGSIDTLRARDITRALLAGIREHRAKVVILDITGVPIVDSGVADHLNKAVQAARLKGAQTIVTGISDAVAETIVDLGIDWGGIETVSDLQTGLRAALASMGLRVG
jgi:sigma-B regulation protein RsbU (phosphoserine phosphatase)